MLWAIWLYFATLTGPGFLPLGDPLAPPGPSGYTQTIPVSQCGPSW